MKAPPKRKGNLAEIDNKIRAAEASMKAPPKRKGNELIMPPCGWGWSASMKAPPKRKGNYKGFQLNKIDDTLPQ